MLPAISCQPSPARILPSVQGTGEGKELKRGRKEKALPWLIGAGLDFGGAFNEKKKKEKISESE